MSDSPSDAAPPGAAAADPAAIEVDELVVRYGDLVAVDRLSLRAAAGEVTALLGPNGAGKTSTIETIEGYRSPTSGAVRVLGLDPIADHARVVESLGIMLQSGGVYSGIHPLEALDLFASYYPDPLDPRALLARVGLSSRGATPWRRLSGGEQQRLSLALAIIGRPRVVVLDEPTAGLDVEGRRLVHRVVRELRDDGVAVLLATHDLADAEALADHVVIVDHGQVVADGPLSEVLAGDGDEIRFTAISGLDTSALALHMRARVEEIEPGVYLVERAPEPAAIAALATWMADQGTALGELRAGRQRLEDVFVRLTQERDAPR